MVEYVDCFTEVHSVTGLNIYSQIINTTTLLSKPPTNI